MRRSGCSWASTAGVAGHSFGADLALAYALETPDTVGGVVAIAPTGVQDDRDWHRMYERGAAAGQDPPPTTSYLVDADVHATGLASWRRWIKQPELLRRIAELQSPYVVVVGERDVRPRWPVEQLTQLVPREPSSSFPTPAMSRG